MAHSLLPHILAVINAASIGVLVVGYGRIRAGNRDGHRQTMLWAIALGAGFLAIYVAYHAGAGLAKFGGAGIVRPIYFTILVVHIVLATVIAVLAPVAIWNALTGRFAMHRALARWAFPIWMFVAVSGLVIYIMTIHIWPYAG